MFIFTITALTIYQGFTGATRYIIDSKKKLQAVELANEQIEQLKNLGYSNLVPGTTVNPAVVRNGIDYTLTTRITDFDDEADGLTPTDVVSWDYLKIGVEVNWANSRQVNMSAIIVPPIREEDADKGYMRIHVIDQNGDAVYDEGSNKQAPHIEVRQIIGNSLIYSGPVNLSGIQFLTGLNPGLYKISVAGNHDYYPVETMSASGTFDPYDEHADIAVKSLLEKYIQTDKIAALNVAIKDIFGNTLSGLGFDIEGGRYLGIDNGIDVYSFADSVSNSDGTESFSYNNPAGFGSFGPHYFDFTDLNDGTTDYTFLWMMAYDAVAGTDTKSDDRIKVMLPADSTLSATAVLAPNNIPSLLVTAVEEDPITFDLSPIANAEVRLELSDPAYDVTRTTDQFGMAYFPVNSGELINDDYDLTVTAADYIQKNDTVTVNDFTEKEIKLTPDI